MGAHCTFLNSFLAPKEDAGGSGGCPTAPSSSSGADLLPHCFPSVSLEEELQPRYPTGKSRGNSTGGAGNTAGEAKSCPPCHTAGPHTASVSSTQPFPVARSCTVLLPARRGSGRPEATWAGCCLVPAISRDKAVNSNISSSVQ